MNRKTTSIIVGLLCTFLVSTATIKAQQPSPTPSPKKDTADNSAVQAGDDAGSYNIVSSIEFGYRGKSIDGDINKYKSDLNYTAGPRLFDSTFLMKSNEGKSTWINTLLVTTTGWGGDPSGQVRVNAENSKWWRFDGNYRRFDYFRFLNNFVNPNWAFTPPVPPNPVTGEHGYDTKTQLGDFELTLLPKDHRFHFTIGYSPERYSGPAFTNYHLGGNDFNYPQNLKSRADDYRFGAEARVAGIDLSFMQGFRRFRDDSFVNLGPTQGINPASSAFDFATFTHNEPTRGSIDFTRFSAHTLIAKQLDITARVVYSKSTTNFTQLENFTGTNFNPRVTGWPPTPPNATPNTLNLGQYNIPGDSERPYWLGDIGATWLVTNKFRISDTFRVEDFNITGNAVFADLFTITRPTGATTRTDTFSINNLDAHRTTEYRKYQNTIEGDYQFNARNGVHFGYRYAHRRVFEGFEGFALNSNGSIPPPTRTSSAEEDKNNTNAFFGGFKTRPISNWTIYFDAEHGTADNVFTRIGNYNYTNFRVKSRYAPRKDLSFNASLITRNNANPSEIAEVSLNDFGVDSKSRVFTSSVDWQVRSDFTIDTGYNYNWLNSDAVVDYFYNSIQHPMGHSLYFVRNSFFFIDMTFRFARRATLFTSYRVNHDSGQGSRVADPLGNPGNLISSYPMSYQSPEARLAIKINRRLDWNFGYQYYNYNESKVVGPRPQNYHAHLPYMSLRVYIGRRE
jgi:hypothetical protein